MRASSCESKDGLGSMEGETLAAGNLGPTKQEDVLWASGTWAQEWQGSLEREAPECRGDISKGTPGWV